MRYLLLALGVIAISGCDVPIGSKAGSYTLFETSKGTIYRLNTVSGKADIIYSPSGMPKLQLENLYMGENDKTYEYIGGGKLKELSTTEAADRLVEKYKK